jgi:hypothetical protein
VIHLEKRIKEWIKSKKTIFPVGHPSERNIIKPKITYFISIGALTEILPV